MKINIFIFIIYLKSLIDINIIIKYKIISKVNLIQCILGIFGVDIIKYKENTVKVIINK